MRTAHCLTIPLMMISTSLSLPGVCQKVEYQYSRPRIFHYEGNIAGNLKIRMTLTERDVSRHTEGRDDAIGTQYRGTYYYVKQPKDILHVSGFYDPQGVGGAEGDFDLEETFQGKETGTFEVRSWTSQGGYSGKWTSGDGNRTYPFVLYRKHTTRRRSTPRKNPVR
jgi:hypothetical protein